MVNGVSVRQLSRDFAQPSAAHFARAIGFAGLVIASLVVSGCSLSTIRMPSFSKAGGEMTLTSLAPPTRTLSSAFSTGVYAPRDKHQFTAVLIEGDVDSPRQAVVIHMFWEPVGGQTPVNATSTNATVSYVIFADAPADQGSGASETADVTSATSSNGDAPRNALGEVGVYTGAGFVFPSGTSGDDRLSGSVRQVDLRLHGENYSDGFVDRLGRAVLTGKFDVKADAQRTQELVQDLEARITERLGYAVRLAGSTPGDSQPGSAKAIVGATVLAE